MRNAKRVPMDYACTAMFLGRGLALLVLLSLVPCCARPLAGPAQARVASESAVAGDGDPLASAAHYATTTTGPGLVGDAVDAALVQSLERSCANAGLKPDGGLARLAEAVAQTSQGGQRAPTGSLVGFHARRLGLIEPTPQLWLAGGPDTEALRGALEAAIAQASSSSRLSHCGAAALRHGRGVVIGLALSARFVTLDRPIPRRVEPDAEVVIAAELAPGYGRPRLAITAPDGQVTRTSLPQDRTLRHALKLPERGEHMLELLGEGPDGVTVLAVFPVAVGVELAARAPNADDAPGEADADAVSARLAELIARERATRELAPLAIEARLADVARAHSEDMFAHHFVAHTSRATGDATDRVARAGLRTSVLLENIGRGYSAAEIHEGLMQSPGHRGNILHPDVRSLGIGVVAEPEGERLAFLATELFARLSPKLDARETPRAIVEGINRARTREKRASVSLDAGLSQAAQAAAEQFAKTPRMGERAALDVALRKAKPPAGVAALGGALVLAADPAQVTDAAQLRDPKLVSIGVGVAELSAEEVHPLVVVLLLGMAR